MILTLIMEYLNCSINAYYIPNHYRQDNSSRIINVCSPRDMNNFGYLAWSSTSMCKALKYWYPLKSLDFKPFWGREQEQVCSLFYEHIYNLIF